MTMSKVRKVSLAKLDEFFSAIAQQRAPVPAGGHRRPGAEYKEWAEGTKWSGRAEHRPLRQGFLLPPDRKPGGLQSARARRSRSSTPAQETRGLRRLRRARLRRASLPRCWTRCSWPSRWIPTTRTAGSTAPSSPWPAPARRRPASARTFGIDPANADGDVTAWHRRETRSICEAKTEKGEKLLDGAVCRDRRTRTTRPWHSSRRHSSASAWPKAAAGTISARRLSARTRPAEFFNAPEWEELSEACLGCGTCTFVCPTCQCYDIRDFNTGHGVKRFRCWDSCMYSDFTKMAARQPRLTQLERFRQRFMHKLVYFPANNEGDVRLRRLRPLPEPNAPSP